LLFAKCRPFRKTSDVPRVIHVILGISVNGHFKKRSMGMKGPPMYFGALSSFLPANLCVPGGDVKLIINNINKLLLLWCGNNNFYMYRIDYSK
jgi:hypothetical protein